MKASNKLSKYAVKAAVVMIIATASCSAASSVGSREDREALVDYLIEKTMQREAFSPVKNMRLNFDVEAAMRASADDVVDAETEEELFYALARLSNSRHDRHLSVSAIEGGIAAPKLYPGSDDRPVPVAPIRVDVDYSNDASLTLFISDVATDRSLLDGVHAGDKILAVNGVDVAERYEQTRPYYRYSTEHGYRKKFSQGFHTRTGLLPPDMYGDHLELRLERVDNSIVEVSLQYVDPDSLDWTGDTRVRYPGFELAADRGAFDLYLSTEDKDVIVIDWHRFNQYLVEDMNWLMEYARDNDLLDHDIVWDGTRSGGGSLGPYAIQRFSPKPFKTTFGNLRISDVIPEFIAERVDSYSAREPMLDAGTSETIDDGTWLIDWLTDDVQKAFDAGQEYTNNVPFKLAHAAKYSDGIIQPADVHFRGNMVCLMGPNGGSHLDQFYAIVTDNDLCTTIGMQTGGYSNTWEWDEEVRFPTTGEPVIRFMWNIGHTISPGGRIVEGDPSAIGDYIPLSRENFARYDQILLNSALNVLQGQD